MRASVLSTLTMSCTSSIVLSEFANLSTSISYKGITDTDGCSSLVIGNWCRVHVIVVRVVHISFKISALYRYCIDR